MGQQSELDKLLKRNTSSISNNDNEESELDKVLKNKPKEQPITEESLSAKIWRKANTPGIDVSPTTRQAMESYQKEHPYLGKVGNLAVDTMLAGSSPIGIGLEAAGGGSALAIKYGSKALAAKLAVPALAANTGAALHGGYKTVEGLHKGDYPEALAGAIETGVGAFGLKHARRAYGETLPPEKMLNTWKPGPIDPTTGERTRVWSHDTARLIQNRTIIPPGKVEPPSNRPPIQVTGDEAKTLNAVEPPVGPNKFLWRNPDGTTTIKDIPDPNFKVKEAAIAAGKEIPVEPPLRAKNLKVQEEPAKAAIKKRRASIKKKPTIVIPEEEPVVVEKPSIIKDETGAIGDIEADRKRFAEKREEKVGPKGQVAPFSSEPTDIAKIRKSWETGNKTEQEKFDDLTNYLLDKSRPSEGDLILQAIKKSREANKKVIDEEPPLTQREIDQSIKEYKDIARLQDQKDKTNKNTLAENLRKTFRDIKAKYTDETGAAGPGTDILVRRRRAREAWKELHSEGSTDPEYKVMVEEFADNKEPLKEGETWKKRLYDFAAGESKALPNVEAPKGTIVPEQKVAQKPTSKTWQKWKGAVDELDATNAPDEAYRDILSTGSRDKSSSETWREKVLRYIELDRNKKVDLSVEEPLRTKYIRELSPGKLTGDISAPYTGEVKPKNTKNRNTARSDKGRFTPPSDMFDRGELEPKPEPSHTDFLKSMVQSLKEKGVKPKLTGDLWNRLKDEKGAVVFGEPAPKSEMQQAVHDWGYGRNKSEILSPYQAKLNLQKQDATLLKYLRSRGINTKGKYLTSPKIWDEISRIDPEAGKDIKNYYSGMRRYEPAQRLARAVGLTKNINLAQGFPGRSGTLSAHGYNLGASDVMARGFKEGITDFVKTTYDPKIDVRYMQDNKSRLPELIENGLDWHGKEYTIGSLEEALRKIPVVGKIRDLQAKFLEHPLFEVKAPAMQLKQAITKMDELLSSGVSRKEAATRAAEFANDFSGHVNKTFKNKTTWDLAQIGFLAPSWLRTRVNIAAKGLTGHPDYVKPVLRGAALGMGIAATDMASMGVGKYLMGKPAEITGIPAGTVKTGKDDKGRTITKQRNIEPLGTSVEPTRTLMQNLTQIAKGDLAYPVKYAFNKVSQPIHASGNLAYNVDPFGNPLTGKDRFGRKIPIIEGALNMLEEAGRPITPGLASALLDYYRGKAPLEEAFTRAMGAPITYTSVPKGKRVRSGSRLNTISGSTATGSLGGSAGGLR